jgi:beta-xylosidase
MPADIPKAQEVVYCNPLPVRIADPFVLQDHGTYYLYGTTAYHTGFTVYTSTDLVHWEDAGLCFKKSEGDWPQRDFWAPEVVERNGTYYIYFAAQHERGGQRRICIATATSPTGPFTLAPKPLLETGSYIDPHPYKDPATGTWYCYIVGEGKTRNGIYGGKLDRAMTSFVTSPTLVLKSSAAWEHDWNEAPEVLFHKGYYYMMYSGYAFDKRGYAVGYATSRHPLGPYKKYAHNPILHFTEKVSGPGHNCIVAPQGSSRYLAFYHTHTSATDLHRVLALDEIQFKKQKNGGPDLMLMPRGPSVTTQTLELGNRRDRK